MPAAKRISDLTGYTAALGTDYLVILDITTNTTKKILVSDFIKSGGGIVKVTKAYTAWQPDGTASKTISILSIPAGFLVTGIKTKHSASFTGGATATALLTIKDDNASGIYNTNFNVFQAPGNTVGCSFTGGVFSTAIPDHTITTNLNAVLTITGAVINNLTAGSVDFWIELKNFKS